MLTEIEAALHAHLSAAEDERDAYKAEVQRLQEFIASKREVRFEARVRGLITVEQYVASLGSDESPACGEPGHVLCGNCAQQGPKTGREEQR